MFPQARQLRWDSDTTTGKFDANAMLKKFRSREADILIGTQMIAKGLDIPAVTLVGVVNADSALNLPDFRAVERTFQLLTQVAGRAGRGPLGGRVIVQTRAPDHHAIVHASGHDVRGFVEAELRERRDPPYPPHVRLANVVLSGKDERTVARAADGLGEWLRALLAARPDVHATVLGPAPCPIERVRDRWRWHLLVKADDDAGLTRLAGYLVARAPVPVGARLVVDRDPASLL